MYISKTFASQRDSHFFCKRDVKSSGSFAEEITQWMPWSFGEPLNCLVSFAKEMFISKRFTFFLQKRCTIIWIFGRRDHTVDALRGGV